MTELTEEEVDHVLLGRTLSAVKSLRERTGLTNRECLDRLRDHPAYASEIAKKGRAATWEKLVAFVSSLEEETEDIEETVEEEADRLTDCTP